MSAPAGNVVQPILHVPPQIQAGIESGALFREGSVVRWADGQIHKHLKEVLAPEKGTEDAAMRAAKLAPKMLVPVVLAALAVGTGATLVIKKRSKSAVRLGAQPVAKAVVPACIGDFEASLRAYVDAGRDRCLDAGIIDRLIADLDEVKAWAEGGNAVEFTLEQLEPLFGLVIEHTPALARAYSVELANFEHQESAGDAGVVVQLRQHLEMQKRMLGETA
jgi:hypothetical protein